MKIKKSTHLLILTMLAFGSFAFYVTAQEQGSDPLTSTPTTGDSSLLTNADAIGAAAGTTPAATPADPNNLTQQVSQQISTAMNAASQSNQDISLDQIKSIVSQSLNATVKDSDLPQIPASDIKVKTENYGNLPADKAAEKKKEDVADYLVSMAYILSSNSPTPITSSDDTTSLENSITGQLSTALTTQNPAALKDLSDSGAKVLGQMKNVEVPQDLVDIHKKGLQLAEYAMQLQNKISPNSADPLSDIANYAKMEALIGVTANYASDAAGKLDQYGLTIGDVQNKLNTYGINIPSDLSQKLSQ